MGQSRLAEKSESTDHRSHAARGLEEMPTVHEGAAARAMESGLKKTDCAGEKGQ